MVDVTGERSAFGSWGPILSHRFQPNIHTRVGALCLYATSLLPIGAGLVWVPQVRVYPNPHAKLPMLNWIEEVLAEATAIFKMVAEDKS